MVGGEFETRDEYEVGRGGVKLPKIEIKDGDFYPHDTVQFLEELWRLNEVDDDVIGQPSSRDTGYFVVPAAENRPVIFAFRETSKRDGQYASPVATYQFFTPPTESGKFLLVMSFTHFSSMNSGFAGGRARLVLQDNVGRETSLSLYGNRWNGAYEPDEFANYRGVGSYTYDSHDSQQSLQALAIKTWELKTLLS